ncbi:hypothetical protein CHUAL_008237 [Chamberlinius hualienensis]
MKTLGLILYVMAVFIIWTTNGVEAAIIREPRTCCPCSLELQCFVGPCCTPWDDWLTAALQKFSAAPKQIS